MVGAYFAASTVAQELVALGFGVGLVSWFGQGKKLSLAKFTGYLIAILAVLALVHTLYNVAMTDATMQRAKMQMQEKMDKGMEKSGSHQ